MPAAPHRDSTPFSSLLGRLQALFGQPDMPQAAEGHDASAMANLMQGSIAAAVHVIIADGEAAEAEFEVATEGLQTHVQQAVLYEPGELADMLHAAAVRARTRSGRIENLRRVSALAGRPMAERRAVFLLAADVADVDGTTAIEERALAEVAAALDVSRTALTDARAGLTAHA